MLNVAMLKGSLSGPRSWSANPRLGNMEVRNEAFKTVFVPGYQCQGSEVY